MAGILYSAMEMKLTPSFNPYKIIIEPQTTFINRIIFLLNLYLKVLTTVVNIKNHIIEAAHTPIIKKLASYNASELLNPPSKSDPSIIACGFIHVTTKLAITIFVKLSSVYFPLIQVDLSIISFIPIHTTAMDPANKIISLTYIDLSIMEPIPKKHAMASEQSKNTMAAAVIQALSLLLFKAEFITYIFCIPIGAV
jgi:hypothetical protein